MAEGKRAAVHQFSLSSSSPSWLQEVLTSYDKDELVSQVTISLVSQSLHGGVLNYNGQIYVEISSTHRQKTIIECHNSPTGGHFGIVATVKRIKIYFYWSGIQGMVTEWVRAYDIYQHCKTEQYTPPGLFQPLPIASQAWQHISMDFIEKLPRPTGYDTIWVVIDRFTKF